MKKLIAMLLVVAFVSVGVVGCGGGETKTTTKVTTPAGGTGDGGKKAP